jgi:hypothetical protein
MKVANSESRWKWTKQLLLQLGSAEFAEVVDSIVFEWPQLDC